MFRSSQGQNDPTQNTVAQHSDIVISLKEINDDISKSLEVPAEDTPDFLEPGSIEVTASDLAQGLGTVPFIPVEGSRQISTNIASEKIASAFGLEKVLGWSDPLLRLATQCAEGDTGTCRDALNL